MGSFFLIVGIVIFWLFVGWLFYAVGGTYKPHDYNPNNPNDIYFNPVARELRDKNEYDKRNW